MTWEWYLGRGLVTFALFYTMFCIYLMVKYIDYKKDPKWVTWTLKGWLISWGVTLIAALLAAIWS